jgi:hypothetical protein
MNRVFNVTCLSALMASLVLADGPKDNQSAEVRPIPPPGIPVPEQEANALKTGLAALRTAIDAAAKAQSKNPMLPDLLPDVEIYHKAVDWALRYNEVFKPAELKAAAELLAEGMTRASQLAAGQTPWTKQTGLVVRAYRSKIDGSIQPYGMVIPGNYSGAPSRLDTWFHGRGETLSELSFLDQRRKQVGQISPANTLVLHPYGRYSCANKLAGEIDLFEALAHAAKFYNIDTNRIVVRGFSMGGAATWQFAANYADKWCAATPGAGFSETPEFLKVFQNEDVYAAPWYQQKLWHWYNATDNALNFIHLPTIAYSGEKDRQKQAADAMEAALRGENMDLLHLIGPGMEHKLHPDSLAEIERRLVDIVRVGRAEMPYEVHFTTYFLRYNHMHWVVVDELEQHWERTRVHAKMVTDSAVEVKTQNVAALTLDVSAGHSPLSPLKRPTVKIDGQEVSVSRPRSDRSWRVHLRKTDGKWQETLRAFENDGLVKKHGLQGPIDDAFMDAFLMVQPSKAGWNPKVDEWVKLEADRALFEWRRQFRGDAMVKADTAVTDADIAANNLVLWGDPQSNALIARVLEKLPIKWTQQMLTANGKDYAAGSHAPVLIFPNPLNPAKYVVINSSFTYREYDYLNNARQVAKLPDWAVIDLTKPRTSQGPGGIADAGFFGEHWEWKKN